MKSVHVLLVHLFANGDCLMATTIARQIKTDYPGCSLTWVISQKCRQVIDNNPDVDTVWCVDFEKGETTIWDVWRRVRLDANARLERGEFDHVFFTQIYPDNISNFDGTTRSSIFRNYSHTITVPVSPVLCLYAKEIDRARSFATDKALNRYRSVILFECSPGSGQSLLNLPKGLTTAQIIVAKHVDALVIVSTHIPFDSPHPRILDGSCLSFRENAALSHFCTLLVGCSSGITWLLTSEAAKKLPSVQFLNKRAMAGGFASVVYDFKHWGLTVDHILESDVEDPESMATVIDSALADFSEARSRYHKVFKPALWDFLIFIDYHSFRGLLRIVQTYILFVRRNQFTWRDMLRLNRLMRVVVCCGFGTIRQLCCRKMPLSHAQM